MGNVSLRKGAGGGAVRAGQRGEGRAARHRLVGWGRPIAAWVPTFLLLSPPRCTAPHGPSRGPAAAESGAAKTPGGAHCRQADIACNVQGRRHGVTKEKESHGQPSDERGGVGARLHTRQGRHPTPEVMLPRNNLSPQRPCCKLNNPQRFFIPLKWLHKSYRELRGGGGRGICVVGIN